MVFFQEKLIKYFFIFLLYFCTFISFVGQSSADNVNSFMSSPLNPTTNILVPLLLKVRDVGAFVPDLDTKINQKKIKKTLCSKKNSM